MSFVLVGGGTAGHIFPTIAVARRLAELAPQSAQLIVCGSRELDRLLYRDVGVDLLELPARGVIGAPWAQIPWRVWLLLRSFLRVWRAFGRLRPSAVIASGGYVSVPVLLVSWLRRVPSVIFSGDAALGWATRVMAPLTSTATISFDEARGQIWRAPVELTGYPIRASFRSPDPAAGRAALGLAADRPAVVVMGGSQGAHAINQALRADLPRLLARASVVHVSGRGDYRALTAERDRLPPELRAAYHVHDFIAEGFANLLAAADVVVSRAGATSVAELGAVGAAAVLIPGQFGAGHQVATAQAVAATGAAVTVRERELASGRLGDVLLEILDDPQRLRAMRAASRARGRPDAAAEVARLGLRLAARGANGGA